MTDKKAKQKFLTVCLAMLLFSSVACLVKVKADYTGENLAPLDAEHWGVYTSYPAPSYPVLYNNHIDYSVLYNGEPTIRIDPHISGVDTNEARESDSLFFMAGPGAHIFFSCWMKVQTGPGTTWYAQHGCGGRIGVDFYNGHYLTGMAYAGEYQYPWTEATSEANAANWVVDANGGVWQYRSLDFHIPESVHDDTYDPTLTLNTMGESYGIIPWMQASPVDSTQSSVWFAHPILLINPEGPEPTSTPTPSPTATPTGSPAPTPIAYPMPVAVPINTYSTFYGVTTTSGFDIALPNQSAFNYQDPDNNGYLTFVFTESSSGTINGAATITANNQGGTLTVTPTTNGRITVLASNEHPSANSLSFASGHTFSISWVPTRYLEPTPTATATPLPWYTIDLTWVAYGVVITGFLCLALVVGHAALKKEDGKK